MEETVLLTVMATYTLLAALCSILFNRLRLPALIGYLVAGIIVTNVFDVTEDWHSVVEILSDIGLVMLMFSIGMEIDISKVLTQGKFAIKIALIQLPLLVLGGTIQIDPIELAKIIENNIRDGVTILGVKGSMKGSEGVVAQSKTVTPSTTEQSVLPDSSEGYTHLSEVIVKAIPYTETENAAGGLTVTIA